MTEAKLFDKEELLDRIGGDEELMEQLIELYLDDYPIKMEAIKSAIKDKNNEMLKASAHGLKGASANLSFNTIFELCQSIEMCAKENICENINDLFSDLEKQTEKLNKLFK